MEGTLWKWTNYFSGWQPRWFVLDNGILSYYKSQDEVNNGSKGSLKMAVCDVTVHPTDGTRLDLCIPGEQYFYVKAATPKERQMWLVALGSCKACLTDEIVSKHNGVVDSSDETDLAVSKEDLKSKKSELRLYCDLLMQQVHSVKSAIEENIPPDVQQLDEATSLLSATCDTFIQTLDEVMFLSHATVQLDTSFQHAPSPGIDPPEVVQGPLLKKPVTRSQVSVRVTSADSMLQAPAHEIRHIPPAMRSKTQVRSLEDMASSRSRTPQRNLSRSYSESSDTNSTREGQRESLDLSDQSDREERKRLRTCPTFFSVMQVSFVHICCNEDGGIPIPKFLEACLALAGVFDKLSATAFAPVKMDFTGNIKKIQQKYSTNPEQFLSLQSLVLYEKKAKESADPNSGTQALLWLKRGLEFISLFLQELAQGEEDLSAAAHKAYSKALKPYHGWVVRGMFGLAMKAAPYKTQFFEHLSVSRTHCASPGFNKQLVSDIRNYTASLESLLNKINKFYSVENLHSAEPV